MVSYLVGQGLDAPFVPVAEDLLSRGYKSSDFPVQSRSIFDRLLSVYSIDEAMRTLAESVDVRTDGLGEPVTPISAEERVALRAYPKTPDARHVIQAHAKWSSAR
jgi:hypothetical protein